MNSNSGGQELKELYYIGPCAIYKTVEKVMHEKLTKYNTTGEWYESITYNQICTLLDELTDSDSFKNCELIRSKYLQEQAIRRSRNTVA